MRINNNVMALNAHRQLGINQAGAGKSMEKLSSGFRINRAGDDAAGLAISEKMRGQIRGLKQATRNAQDGISLIQTAEGALNETHAILQRMRELAVQSSTDTNEPDRDEIQKEINQLAEEITRISTDTEFNTQKLLGGKFNDKVFHIGANEAQNVKLSIADMSANALKVAGDGDGIASKDVKVTTLVDDITSSAISASTDEQSFDVVKLDNVVIGSGGTAITANYGLTNDKGEVVAISNDGQKYSLLTEATSETKLAEATVVTGKDLDFGTGEAVISGKVTMKVEAGADADTQITVSEFKGSSSVKASGLESGSYENKAITAGNFADYFGAGEGKIAVNTTNGLAQADITNVLVDSDNKVVAVTFNNHAGEYYAVDDVDFNASNTDADDRITAAIGDSEAAITTTLATGDKLEIKADGGINVSDQKSADKAITTINKALETVSAERSKLGAMQNRLEHTIANLGTSAENLQAAESRIRDLDMADEIMDFTKNNILQQAATAMLAQANMAPQSVLQLLG